MKEFKQQVLTFKSNTVMDGLDKVAKNVLNCNNKLKKNSLIRQFRQTLYLIIVTEIIE